MSTPKLPNCYPFFFPIEWLPDRLLSSWILPLLSFHTPQTHGDAGHSATWNMTTKPSYHFSRKKPRDVDSLTKKKCGCFFQHQIWSFLFASLRELFVAAGRAGVSGPGRRSCRSRETCSDRNHSADFGGHGHGWLKIRWFLSHGNGLFWVKYWHMANKD